MLVFIMKNPIDPRSNGRDKSSEGHLMIRPTSIHYHPITLPIQESQGHLCTLILIYISPVTTFINDPWEHSSHKREFLSTPFKQTVVFIYS